MTAYRLTLPLVPWPSTMNPPDLVPELVEWLNRPVSEDARIAAAALLGEQAS